MMLYHGKTISAYDEYAANVYKHKHPSERYEDKFINTYNSLYGIDLENEFMSKFEDGYELPAILAAYSSYYKVASTLEAMENSHNPQFSKNADELLDMVGDKGLPTIQEGW
jgi:hypothetical protein